MDFPLNLLCGRRVARSAQQRAAKLATIKFRTPAFPPGFEPDPESIERARSALLAGDWPKNRLLPEVCLDPYLAVLRLMYHYSGAAESVGRLYVLEFQGHRDQYLKFGQSTTVERRWRQLCDQARPHGFALLNAWVSPGIEDVYRVEQMVLQCATRFPHDHRFGERFYGMRFETGRDIGRAVVDEYSDDASFTLRW